MFIMFIMFPIATMEIICLKTYLSLLYELFKIEVLQITQKWDCTKLFSV